MHRQILVSQTTHEKIRQQAFEKRISMSKCAEHFISVAEKAQQTFSDINGMKKGDTYRFDFPDKVTVLRCEDVHKRKA